MYLSLTAFISGCASQNINQTPTQTYKVGQRIQAAPGGVILSSQAGQLRTTRKWVGVINSPDGWETSTASDSSFIRKELLYSGISGKTIEIGYREYRGGLAAAAFYQSAKYDISVSNEISFQNFRLRIDSADNNGLTGVLLSDGITSAASSPKSQGRDAFNAERLALQSCNATPQASLTSKGAGFENYSITCANGDTLFVRCELGNCRELK